MYIMKERKKRFTTERKEHCKSWNYIHCWYLLCKTNKSKYLKFQWNKIVNFIFLNMHNCIYSAVILTKWRKSLFITCTFLMWRSSARFHHVYITQNTFIRNCTIHFLNHHHFKFVLYINIYIIVYRNHVYISMQACDAEIMYGGKNDK